MHFDTIYPDTAVGEEVEPHIVKVKEQKLCAFCNTPTGWYDVATKRYSCSHKCITHLRYKILELKEE